MLAGGLDDDQQSIPDYRHKDKCADKGRQTFPPKMRLLRSEAQAEKRIFLYLTIKGCESWRLRALMCSVITAHNQHDWMPVHAIFRLSQRSSLPFDTLGPLKYAGHRQGALITADDARSVKHRCSCGCHTRSKTAPHAGVPLCVMVNQVVIISAVSPIRIQ